jgi:hypothetical protein
VFEWLIDEMRQIRNRKFHVVDGPMPDKMRKLVEQSDIPVPPSYKAFVTRFGNANLYWAGAEYRVRVFAFPKEVISSEGESLRYFGRTDLALAYFKEALLVEGEESPVFEWHHEDGFQVVADGFEEWLIERSRYARERFGEVEWQAILAGPPPFDERELAIVRARRKFRWQVIGISPEGNIRFEVFNGSDISLPYLSIGIRGPLRDRDEVLNGGVWLPVHHIGPGKTGVVEKDCYKDLVNPKNAQAFDEPDPGPEDRNRYWEFRQLPAGSGQ